MEKTNSLTIGLVSEKRPDVIFDLKNGQGSFLFNHNIKEVEASELDGFENDDVAGTVFVYDSLRCEYPKTADNIFSTLLAAKYSPQRESKLLNEYQSAQNGILDESYKEPYLDFLRDRLAIREMINNECETLNIPIEQ